MKSVDKWMVNPTNPRSLVRFVPDEQAYGEPDVRWLRRQAHRCYLTAIGDLPSADIKMRPNIRDALRALEIIERVYGLAPRIAAGAEPKLLTDNELGDLAQQLLRLNGAK